MLTLAAFGSGASGAAAQGPAIDWTMPSRLGPDRNGDGLMDYANSAAEFERNENGFAVDLEARADLCRDDATYTWTSSAGRTVEAGRGGCRVRQSFAHEGPQRISLQVRGSDGAGKTYSREIEVRDWLIVSIGDSVASGEGNPEDGDGPRGDGWQSTRCHRSSLASPAQAALALERSDPHTSTTFVHLACSGAKVSTGLLRAYAGIDPPNNSSLLPPQIEELERIDSVRGVDAVLVSGGANDIYFGPMVRFCILKRNCPAKRFDPKDPEHPTRGRALLLPQVVDAALGRLKHEYAELARRLARVVAPSRTLIVDYFDPTRDETGAFCKRIGLADPLFGLGQIDRAEAEWASIQVLAPLNREIGAAAEAAGWTEVSGISEAFRTHGYCADEPWVRHLTRSLFSQGDLSGAMHPNEEGHRETALLIGDALQRVLGMPQPHVTGAGGEVTVTVDEGNGDEVTESTAEANTEHVALIVLAAVALLAALAVTVLFRILRGPFSPLIYEYPAGEAGYVPPPGAWPPAASVAAFGSMIESSSQWVHRRVESVEILDERMVRRRVSVDFTPEAPVGTPAPTHAPIALLAKRTLSRFDLRDEAGASVPLLTREQNAAFSTAHMLVIAEEAIGEAPGEELVSLCWTIARGEPEEAEEAITEIATQLEPQAQREALRESERFRAATSTFADSFPVIIALREPTRRRVIKLAYNHVVGGGPNRRQRLGIDPILAWFEIPELGDASSRHIEFLGAEGLDAFNAQLIGVAPDGTFIVSEDADDDDEPHLSVAKAPLGTRGLAGVFLRASRSGILVGGPLLAALSAAALTGTWFALPQLAGENSGGAASILLAVPAALGAYLGARKPHPLEAALLSGPRVLVFLSGMLAFLGAGALALDASVESLRIGLGVLALLSWMPVVGLVLTYLLPRGHG